MLDSEHPTLRPRPHIPDLAAVVMALALTGAIVMTGCDSADDAAVDGEIARIAISPDTAFIAVGETIDFELAALNAYGDTIRDANLDITWWSSNTTVFTVANDGLATGKQSGTAYCKVVATSNEADKTALRFTGRDSAFVSVL